MSDENVTLSKDELQNLVSKAVSQALKASVPVVQQSSGSGPQACKTCGEDMPHPPDSGMNPECPRCTQPLVRSYKKTA